MARKITQFRPAAPPTLDQLPLVNASAEVARWLEHYWRKLKLPPQQAHFLGVTDDRQEFARWTGRRLNPMALGCYCYLPLPPDDVARESEGAAQGAPVGPGCPTDPAVSSVGAAQGGYDLAMRAASTRPGASGFGAATASIQLALPGFADAPTAQDGALILSNPSLRVVHGDHTGHAEHDHNGHTDRDDDEAIEFRHLIFVEPELLPEGIEVTVAHELIHLADRASGHPRKHHCHGHDAISVDEAALTERDPDWLRDLLAEETRRREATLRLARPYRYYYVCPNCGKEYPRVLKYRRAVSCGHCDHHFNPAFLLRLRDEA